MKALVNVTPTPEQLPIIANPVAGVTLIRGAAGSGKTTTALLMLRQLSEFWIQRRSRAQNPEQVKILVLTFNKTLRGYVEHLVLEQIQNSSKINLTINTFAKWSKDLTGTDSSEILSYSAPYLTSLCSSFTMPNKFLLDEIDYCLGRFLTQNLDDYLTIKRSGRGASPRMDQKLRLRLLNEVIKPYNEIKKKKGLKDWNDIALELVENPNPKRYDVVIIDETQDFSANQMRAVMNHVKELSTTVLVIDSAQKIYPRGFKWGEVDILIQPNRSFKLNHNHRNTIQICNIAKSLLKNLQIGSDGCLPNLDSCSKQGELPKFLKGRFSKQCTYAISKIKTSIDLTKESVAFAHAKGGGWFDYLKDQLDSSNIDYVEMSKTKEWPTGNVNVGLITMHSSKGLEFDHVFILGLNQELTPHGDDDDDTDLETLRRLLAMAITRARKTVTIGSTENDKSTLFQYFESGSYREVLV